MFCEAEQVLYLERTGMVPPQGKEIQSVFRTPVLTVLSVSFATLSSTSKALNLMRPCLTCSVFMFEQ